MKSTCFVDNPNITASSRVSSALLAVSNDVHTEINLIYSCLESRIGVLLKFPHFYPETPPLTTGFMKLFMNSQSGS